MIDPIHKISYVAMPAEYISSFTAALIKHHSTQLRQAMNCSEEMAQLITMQQIQELQKKKHEPSHQYLVAAQWQRDIIGGAWYYAPPKQVAILQWLMIEPAFQGQGHGKRLLAHVIAQSCSAESVGLALHVFIANHKSVSLYEGMGFSDVGKEMYLTW
ncbi:GNAT family N-acetyltransferase [Acidithiobacillus thiooxidans]|uniref:Putative N-acetyltransferase YycN n=1 Tax=Acidithiobacillus thiooxidans ATCC 19377 TaxID=637390 RepID=A0A543Q5A0_ACITH|nr:GNAT family N-acetyltransferase [Acidithiobacillus thiooxidans]MDX5934397.1 GNAT family N-acetyltransferase [Acidithiobacillus thiooxidans]TQN51488.1 putative N-acetyltransferase YycN [Acidithiobacillus thiooxidans ATCC 19377]